MSEAPLTYGELEDLLDAVDGYISEWPCTDDLIRMRDHLDRIIQEMRQKQPPST